MEQLLENLHYCELIVCNEIKRICEKNNIQYFLYFGSMLGAIRHKGFIPWDDDMDIAMTRENYIKFLNAFQKMGDKKHFYLEERSLNSKYPLQFAKMKLMNTKFIENSTRKTDLNKGIFVDIFPLDFCSSDKKLRCSQKKRFQNYVKILKFKLNYLPTDPYNKKHLIVSRLIKYMAVIYTQTSLQKKIDKYSWINNQLSEYIGSSSSAYEDDAIPYEWLSETIILPFETEEYPVPKMYDNILRSIYGDYMKLPSEEQCKPRHFPKIIDYGSYQLEVKNK